MPSLVKLLGEAKAERMLTCLIVAEPTFVKERDRAGKLPSSSRLKAAMKSFFRRQQQRVLEHILPKSLRQKASLPTGFSMSFDDEELSNVVRPHLTEAYKSGAESAKDRLGLDETAGPSLSKSQDAMRRASFKFAESTNASTSLELNEALDRLREDLAAGLAEGETNAELTKRVSAVFDRASKQRAETIAMSETSRAMHAGQAEAAKESGLEIRLKWLVSSDACPICLEIAADNPEGVPVGSNFASIGEGPYADIPYPPAHPRCQCSMTEEVVGKASQEDDNAA